MTLLEKDIDFLVKDDLQKEKSTNYIRSRLQSANERLESAHIIIEELEDEVKGLHDHLVTHYNRVKCPQCKLHFKVANETIKKLTEWRAQQTETKKEESI